MMKQLLIVANGLSVRGGIGNCLYRMLQVLRDHAGNFAVDLLLWDVESAKILKDDFPNVTVLAMQKDNVLMQSSKCILLEGVRNGTLFQAANIVKMRGLYHMNFTLPLINRTAESVKSLPKTYDVAIAYAALPTYITSYVAFSVKADKKIAWVHGDVDQKEAKKIKGYTPLRTKGLYQYTAILNRFHQIVAVSQAVKRSMQKEFPDCKAPISVIHNITDASEIRRNAGNQIKDFSFDGIKLLTIGRLSNEKGIDLAVRTMYCLKQQGLQFRWYFIGEDNRPLDVKRYIKNKGLEDVFVYLGTTDCPYPYISACDIYVHTSYLEGYCTAIEEARVLGKPIVTTDVAGADEQIRNGWNGFVVSKQAQCISKALARLIQDKTLRNAFERNSRQIVWDNSQSVLKIKTLLEQ